MATAGVLLLLSAFFSGSETAFFSLSKDQISSIQEKKQRNAELLVSLMDKQSDLLVTILFGNTLVNVAASVLATAAMFELCGYYGFRDVYGVAAAVVFMPLLLLIVGEVTPKSIALRNSQKFALRAAPVISLFGTIFHPVVVVLRKISVMTTIFKVRGRPHPFLSEEEVKTLFRMSGEEGVFEEDEKEMIDSIFEFGETVVKEVMVPRTDICAIEVGMSRNDVVDIIREHGHSRIPVYQESIDDVVGLLYAKDLLRYIREPDKDFNLASILRKAHFVPENKNIDDLLREFKRDKMHLAIVVDEYGGTSGLVTMEDLLEEIVGEIFDEYDVEEKLFEVINENTLLADGKLDIGEFNETFDVELPAEDSETLGGFLLDQLGEVPAAKRSLEYDGLEFIVEKVIKHRIVSIRILFRDKQVPEHLRK